MWAVAFLSVHDVVQFVAHLVLCCVVCANELHVQMSSPSTWAVLVLSETTWIRGQSRHNDAPRGHKGRHFAGCVHNLYTICICLQLLLHVFETDCPDFLTSDHFWTCARLLMG
jgi:hypothetical protein